MSDFIIIAHRGASGNWPENSLLAFDKALAAGAKWLELDVHLSADGELVVIHDAGLQRTSNGKGAVSDLSLAELRRFDVGQGEAIPLLSEVLDLAAGRATVNIELKGNGVEIPTVALLRKRLATGEQSTEEFLASSLNENRLIRFAEQLPQIRVAPVADRPTDRTWALAKRLDAWSVHVAKATVNQRLIDEAQRQNRKLLVYTVNDPDEVEKLQGWGVSGVFTDYPELLIGKS